MNKIEELLKTFYYHDPDELGEDAFNNLGDDEIAEAKQAINAYILGEVMELIGADECFVESTNKPTEQLNKFGSYIKGQNELRQELRNKANKKWGK